MSEYFTFEIEMTDDPDVVELITNQTLTLAKEEVYNSPEDGDEGSPIAQTLFSGVDGIAALTLMEQTLIVRREEDIVWEELIDEIRDALRDFFL